MSNDYPKMLYLGGQHGAKYRAVEDADAERAARADGYAPIGEAKAAPKKPAPKPVAKAKAKPRKGR